MAHFAIAVLTTAPAITDKVLQKTTSSESLILFLLGAAMIGVAGLLLRSQKSPPQGATERVRASAEEAAAQQSSAQASRAEVA
jgi:hypothetical protein